jgi:hypothetical protein
MCSRLTLLVAAMALSFAASASPQDREEQDQNCGRLLFEIARILATKPNLDTDARVALGASLEFLFVQLQRSKTRSATVALARTAVLKLDAGGSESRSEAILSKGMPMVAELKKVSTADYLRLCAASTAAVVCQSQAEVAKYVASLTEPLRRSSAVSR